MIVLSIFLCIPLVHAQEDWELSRDKEGIRVYTRQNEGMQFKEFKTDMQVSADMSAFVAVLFDVEALSVWGHNVKSAQLMRRPVDTVQVYYAVAKAPFPYKNRDGVYQNRFIWNPESRSLKVDIELLDEFVDRRQDLVRIEGYGYWEATETEDGKLNLLFQMQMDPGGNVPAWLANMFASDTPYMTMKGMRDILKNKKYQGKSYSFLN